LIPKLKEDPVHGMKINFQNNQLELFADGALYWPDKSLLIVSDLHLEKASSFAAKRGVMLPPYDTQATLEMLATRITQLQPAKVISLGDSFHDEDASVRLPNSYRLALKQLMEGREWIWICGNHDPSPPEDLGGVFCEEMYVGNLHFKHEPLPSFKMGEIAGHLHPCAKIKRKGKTVRRKCFVSDSNRIILPAYGAFTGGLNVRDSAYEGLFETDSLVSWMLSGDSIFQMSGRQLVL